MQTIGEMMADEEARLIAEARTPERIAADMAQMERNRERGAAEMASLERQGLLDDGTEEEEDA